VVEALADVKQVNRNPSWAPDKLDLESDGRQLGSNTLAREFGISDIEVRVLNFRLII
jgi:hypothetical protein